MKRLLLLLLVLFVGVSTLSAKEEEKTYTDEERSALIFQAIRGGNVELIVDPWGGSGVECERYERGAKGYVASEKGRPLFCERG